MVVVLALAASVLVTSKAASASKVPRSSVLLVGDSLAVGLTKPLGDLARAEDLGFHAEAIGGTRIDQWAPKVEGLIAKYQPSTLLVCLGTNDAFSTVTASKRRDTQRLVDAARSKGIEVIWILPPTLPPTQSGPFGVVRNQDDQVREFIAATGVPTIDSRTFSFERSPDKIHATARGYRTWAELIWRSLSEI